MMKSFIDRENEILDILERFSKANLNYVLVGGYAVSAYMHRFSVDADVCISKENFAKFKEILHSRSFEPKKRRDLDDMYKGEFASFVNKGKLPVTVDLMINSLGSRQTDASFSFKQLFENSHEEKVVGIEKSILSRIPKKELLIALKIHAARMTDARDIVALCDNVDFSIIANFVNRGAKEQLRKNIDSLILYLRDKRFKDSFKGVFSIEKLPVDNINNALKLLETLAKTIK